MTDPFSVKFTKVAWYLRNWLHVCWGGKFPVHFLTGPSTISLKDWRLQVTMYVVKKETSLIKFIERWFTKWCSTVQSLDMPCLTFHTDEWLTSCTRSGLRFPGIKCKLKYLMLKVMFSGFVSKEYPFLKGFKKFSNEVERKFALQFSAKSLCLVFTSLKHFMPSNNMDLSTPKKNSFHLK